MIRLYKLLKPYRFFIVAILLLVFFQTLTNLYLPTLMSDIIDNGIMLGDTDYILRIGGIMLLIAALGTLCAMISSLLSSKAAVGLGRIIRDKVFFRVESYSLQEFDKLGTSTLITRTTNDIVQVQNVTLLILRMMISAPMMAIGGIIMATSEDKGLTWILVVALPVLAAVIALIASKGMPFFKIMQVKLDKINLVLRENLTGIRVVRAFNKVEHEKERFEQANDDLTRNYIKVNIIMAFLMPTLLLIMNLTSISIVWFGSIRIDNGSMQLGSMIAFVQYTMQIMFSMIMFSMMFIMIPRAQAASDRINEVLDIQPSINDIKDIKSINVKKGIIEFKNVVFRYQGAEEPVLKNISFTAKPGQTTAIIGGTGSGKSTLVNLILRFYDIEKGEILIDGVNIREVSQHDLRAQIGYVPQQAILFSGTIKENIIYGNENATQDDIERAATVAQAMNFISSFDKGLEHEISQGGSNVSGGQKQRLSIARALVKRPKVFVFDDSFSALDFKTDARLRSALKQETTESTIIVVAQRVGTIMEAEQIIVLDEGEIVGIGTHKELLKSCKVYYEIVASQLSEEELA